MSGDHRCPSWSSRGGRPAVHRACCQWTPDQRLIQYGKADIRRLLSPSTEPRTLDTCSKATGKSVEDRSRGRFSPFRDVRLSVVRQHATGPQNEKNRVTKGEPARQREPSRVRCHFRPGTPAPQANALPSRPGRSAGTTTKSCPKGDAVRARTTLLRRSGTSARGQSALPHCRCWAVAPRYGVTSPATRCPRRSNPAARGSDREQRRPPP